MKGARAVQQSILADLPDTEISVAFVWIDMVVGDSRTTAEQIAATIVDPRAAHWHDLHKAAGKAMAESLGGSGEVAWDTYSLYAPAQRWTQSVPYPVDWAHQLTRNAFANSSHYRSGNALTGKLHEWMDLLVVSHAHSQA